MDARTKGIRERETGVSEHVHRIRQLERIGWASASALASAMTLLLWEPSVPRNTLLGITGGVAVGYVGLLGFESKARTEATVSSLLRKISSITPSDPKFKLAVSDLSYLSGLGRLGSKTRNAEAVLRMVRQSNSPT